MSGKLDSAGLETLMTPALEWQPGDRYHIRSACGRYTVAKYHHCGAATYEAWRVGKPPIPVGMAPTAEQAKALAAKHAAREAA